VDNHPLIAPYDIENDTIVLPPPEPFPTTFVVVAVVILVVFGFGLLINLTRRKRVKKL
jgi:uncharacterized membrane protein